MAIKGLHAWIDSLLDKLFAPEQRRLDAMVTELDRQNRELKKHAKHGFMHAGRVFTPKDAPYIKEKSGYPSLSFSLSAQANRFINSITEMENDRQQIKQVLWLLLSPCSTREDLRNALPESLVELAWDLREWPRTNADGYTLIGDERATNQYLKIRDKIDIYWASSMIY